MTEKDPHGTNQHAPGAKLDAGKNKLGLVLGDFANALMAVGEVGTFGSLKYSESGWLDVPNGMARYRDAMFRHFFKESAGELIDPDSDQYHAACGAWNALAYLELLIRSEQKSSTV